jgi:polyhydroxyalkanoic acid synthase PhaR subunit
MELWKQWYAAATGAWSSALGGDFARYMDPFGLYRELPPKAPEGARGSPSAGPTGMADPLKLWQQWLSMMLGAWSRDAAGGMDPSGLAKRWAEMMDEARARLEGGKAAVPDPFELFRQWYEGTSEPWSRMLAGVIASEPYVAAVSRFLEGYTAYVKAVHGASEAYISALQLPTRADVARVAGLVVALEDKVDRIEDALEASSEASPRAAPAGSPEDLEGRIRRIEDKLDRLLTAIGQVEARNGSRPQAATNGATRPARKSNGSTRARRTAREANSSEPNTSAT